MKVLERVYKAVPDIINMPHELKRLADQYRREGYMVERGPVGTVILRLDDGEVHYYPKNSAIIEALFSH